MLCDMVIIACPQRESAAACHFAPGWDGWDLLLLHSRDRDLGMLSVCLSRGRQPVPELEAEKGQG